MGCQLHVDGAGRCTRGEQTLMMTNRAPDLYAAAKSTVLCQLEMSKPGTSALARPARAVRARIGAFMILRSLVHLV